MAAAELRQGSGEGEFGLVGELGFDNVPDLLSRSEPLFRDCPALRIDLAGVSRADSAGLALLVEWVRRARGLGRTVSLVGMPRQMRDIVRVSGLNEVLALDPE